MADVILFLAIAGALISGALVGGRAAYLAAAGMCLLTLALVLATTPATDLSGWGLLAGLVVGGVGGALVTARND